MADADQNVPIPTDSDSPQARGFKPGLDDELERAEEENLKEAYKEEEAEGATEEAKDIKEDLEALEEEEKEDAQKDPKDEVPDNTIG